MLKILNTLLLITGISLILLGIYGFKLDMILQPIIIILFGVFYLFSSIKNFKKL